MKLFFCDTETTGVSSNAAIIQFAGIYIDSQTKDEERINFFMKPHEGAEISDKALEVNKMLRDQILRFPDYHKTYSDIIKFFDSKVDKFDKADKMHFVAWNGIFDWQKFYELSLRCGNKYAGSYFHNPSIDVKQIVNIDLISKNKRPNTYFNLEDTLDLYVIKKPEGDFHGAMYDIICTKLMFDHFVKY